MSDEHVSYKANLQTASTKSWATMGSPAKRFSDGVFLAGREWPDFTCLLGASEVDQFLSLHAFIPRTRLWRGATGNRKVIGVSPTQKRFGISAFFCK